MLWSAVFRTRIQTDNINQQIKLKVETDNRRELTSSSGGGGGGGGWGGGPECPQVDCIGKI